MSTPTHLKADVAVIGAGLAGIVTTLQLLDAGRRVVLIDRGAQQLFGGLARRAFGGMWLADTPLQRRNGIRDNQEMALADWLRYAELGPEDVWPRRWAEYYVEHCVPEVYEWLGRRKIGFLPAAQWPEKGLYQPGNSVPRYHVLWGTSRRMTEQLIAALHAHPNNARLTLCWQHMVEHIEYQQGRVQSCSGRRGGTDQSQASAFQIEAEHFVLACGGITGNLKKVRANWPQNWPPAPERLLNGSHPHNDGRLHEAVSELGGCVTHLDKHWNYAAGVRHPRPAFADHGLSLIPCRSALWLDHRGHRIGPQPLVTGYDTRYLCEQVVHYPWTWQIFNRKIALKELAVSGAEHNPSIRDRSVLGLVGELLFGCRWLLDEMLQHCEDFVSADNLPDLIQQMNNLTGSASIDAEVLKQDVQAYDAGIARGRKYHNDDQLRRIAQLRGWSGDRLRTCNFQRIVDDDAGPLIAVRLQMITRKTLGGMQTDLCSRVLNQNGEAIAGLYAVGEAAGFGGGGASGLRSLEGHCLPACIMTAQAAARAIIDGQNQLNPASIGTV